MTNSEDKILKKIYWFETKNFIVKVITFVFFLALAGLFGTTLYNQWVEQQTMDLLQIFQEDFEIIRRYLGEVIATFFEETPKITLTIFGASIIILCFFLLLFLANFSRIKNKIRSLVKYWLKH